MPEFRTSGEKEQRIIDLGKVYERVDVDFDGKIDMKIQTGATISLGKGSIYFTSILQKNQHQGLH